MNKHDPLKDHPEIIAVKERAKELREEYPDMPQGHAIELASREKGFNTYAALRASVKGETS